VATGVVLKESPRRIEVSAVPTAAMWHPLLGAGPTRDYEDRIVTANSEYKLMQWNADNKTCRRTTLGPTFGQPINKLVPLVSPAQQRERDTDSDAAGSVDMSAPHPRLGYLAYSTCEKVVGLCKMPLDGNPDKGMGLIAHPGPVSAIAVSHDSRILVTAGGPDCTVNLWQIHTEVLDAAEAGSYDAALVERANAGDPTLTPKEISEANRAKMAPFVALLDGGEGGPAHEDLIDLFYYAQLRSQGENTTAPREVNGRVPLTEIPNLVRALGYFPSEQQVSNMVSEVKYAKFTTTGDVVDFIDLPQFVQLYVNHRPLYGVNKQEIEEAFKVLSDAAASASLMMLVNDDNAGAGGEGLAALPAAAGYNDSSSVKWGELKQKLSTAGEQLSEEDLKVCLRALTGSDDLPVDEITAGSFIDQVLGFEDYEE